METAVLSDRPGRFGTFELVPPIRELPGMDSISPGLRYLSTTTAQRSRAWLNSEKGANQWSTQHFWSLPQA
jgi:hypothetical protein